MDELNGSVIIAVFIIVCIVISVLGVGLIIREVPEQKTVERKVHRIEYIGGGTGTSKGTVLYTNESQIIIHGWKTSLSENSTYRLKLREDIHTDLWYLKDCTEIEVSDDE